MASPVKLSVNKWHSRSCLAALSMGIAAHTWMLVTGTHGVWMTIAAPAMLAVCVPCVPGMWKGPTMQSAKRLMVMAMGMALFHAVMLILPSQSAGHAHGAASAGHQVDMATASMLLIIAVELLTAFLLATVLSAHRRTIAIVPVQPSH